MTKSHGHAGNNPPGRPGARAESGLPVSES
jgi:hypothetical protein